MQTAISIIYTISGILYTFIAGRGKVYCYLFGIIAACCYSYLAFQNHIFGNFLLNIGYYLPMQIIGIFEWKKHLKKDKQEIIKQNLANKERFFLGSISVIACIILVSYLSHSKETTPLLDGITTVLSILGMYLTVKRCIEQWLIWIIVNSLTIIMWIKLSLKNTQTYSTIIVWTIYLILGIYFYIQWRKELTQEK